MSQQKEAECFVCHQKIYISKPYPDSKWVKTNLDGSAHVDPYRPQQSTYQRPIQQQQQQSTPNINDFDSGQTIRKELSKNLDETIKLRDKTIQESFEKKMDAYDELTTKIEGLSKSIDNQTAVITSQNLILQGLVDVLKIKYGIHDA